MHNSASNSIEISTRKRWFQRIHKSIFSVRPPDFSTGLGLILSNAPPIDRNEISDIIC